MIVCDLLKMMCGMLKFKILFLLLIDLYEFRFTTFRVRCVFVRELFSVLMDGVYGIEDVLWC